MQKEYKNAMEKISLSDSDRARILANVKKAYEESAQTPDTENKVVSVERRRRPRFSTRQLGMAAAACVVVVVGTLVIRGQFFEEDPQGNVENPVVVANNAVEWIELESVDDIEKETDCKTYTLSNLSSDYKVKKVEVAKEQRHVKIMYREKRHHNRILFEYKEEENATDVTDQFAEQNELDTQKVGDREVTMYGDKECEAMTWQQESCTFAVTMSESCSKSKAAKLVSGTKEKKDVEKEEHSHVKKVKKGISKCAVGWDGTEGETSSEERHRILSKIYEMCGFRVTIEDPAQKVAYKLMDNFESFSFIYPEIKELDGRRVVGYAGREGSPDGVLDGFDQGEAISVNGITIHVYVNSDGEEIYTFTKKEVNFTLLVGEIQVEEKERMLSGLLSVIHISLDAGKRDDPQEKEEPDSEVEEEPDKKEEEKVARYQEMARKIQYAVADGSLEKLSTYIQFPLKIKGLDISVASAREFQSLESSMIFTSAWVDRIASYDARKIRENARTITMGGGSNFLICKVKNNTLLITEMGIERTVKEPPKEEPTKEPEPTPSEE